MAAMICIKQIERLQKMHELISSEKTGIPSAFASKLGISRRQLYNELENFKNHDAPIKYCKQRESFYYTEPFDIELIFSFKIITKGEAKKIFGGLDCSARLLHGSLFTLERRKSFEDYYLND